MKWFKHASNARRDGFIQDLIREFGPAGYAYWFMLIETIAEDNGTNVTGEIESSLANIAKNLNISRKKLEVFLNFCQGFSKVLFTVSGNRINIKIPSLLKIKDNHTRNLQVAKKKVSPILDKNKIREDKIRGRGERPPEEGTGGLVPSPVKPPPGRISNFPDQFAIPDEMRAWAGETLKAAQAEHIDIDRETEKFRNHAISSGKRSLDWSLEWCNWILKAIDIYKKPSLAPAANKKNSSLVKTTQGIDYQKGAF